MPMMNIPDKNKKFPLEHYDRLCFLKNVVKNPNIIVGDYTYYDDFEHVDNFEKNEVLYHKAYLKLSKAFNRDVSGEYLDQLPVHNEEAVFSY